mmetsp:Transcript_18586/g.43673  ORF Transcript_18586/g.43673 Transcript_18586/m.43673 type:complete len:474 (-) Transcript_18586:254-1675(-)
MVTDLLSRVACHRGCNEPLIISLKRITEVGAVDMTPKRLQELLAPVVEATHDGASRREIMRHLCDCLSEPTGKRWQRIYGALVLTEKLVHHGSNDLLIETAHGHHFDLVQKVAFLEHFDSATRGCSDRRAQHLVRKKASELRLLLIPRLRKASTEELPANTCLCPTKDTASTCSPHTTSSTTMSSSIRSTCGSSDSLTESRSPRNSRASPVSSPGQNDADRHAGLEMELKALTESKSTEFPRELLIAIATASHIASSRQTIMTYLQNCLAEPDAKHWRRVHVGLSITEMLMEQGSPLIFTETIPGVDLDLPKQIWFLEQFECRANWRAQNLVRTKAIELRERMVPWLLNNDQAQEPVLDSCECIDEAFSTLRSWAESPSGTDGPCFKSVEPLPSEVSSGTPDGDSESQQGLPPPQGQGASGSAPFCTVASEECRAHAAGEPNEGETSVDAFYTPAQTPAAWMAKVRAAHVISL